MPPTALTAEAPDGLPVPRRYWAVLTIAMGLVMAVMDGAIANVALPTIAKDLHASPAFAIWIVNGYQLAVTISLLPLASLGEIFGYRRVYLAGLALFTIASLLCAFSDSLGGLAVARVIQGFGAAGIMSVNSLWSASYIRTEFSAAAYSRRRLWLEGVEVHHARLWQRISVCQSPWHPQGYDKTPRIFTECDSNWRGMLGSSPWPASHGVTCLCPQCVTHSFPLLR